ncbi:MAG: hypothetical protein M1823_006077, partial [Watsoniomyces obsoletus]
GDTLGKRSLSPTLRLSLDKSVKGSLVQAHSGAQAEDELVQMQTISRARAARQAGHTRQVVQKGGVITVANAQHAIRVREEDELLRAQTTLEKAERAVQRKKNKHWPPVWKDLKRTAKSRSTRLRQQERDAERARKASQRHQNS